MQEIINLINYFMVNPFTIIAPFLLPISIAGCMISGYLLFNLKKDFESSFDRVTLYLLLTPCLIFLVIMVISSFLHILGFIIELFN